jgi:cobalt-zinc-cadmium efflux system outer membrane protein
VLASDKGDAVRLSNQIERTYQTIESRPMAFNPDGGLDDYLAYAALNNPGVKAAFYRWKSELEKTGYVSALPDPEFSYGYFVENVETRVGPQNQRFSLKQSYPWFGTLGKKGDVAFEAANAAFQQYQMEKLTLYYRVRSDYYDYYYLGREIQFTKDNMELLKYWESVARAKFKAGLAQHPDVIKAQVELGKLEDRLRTVEEMVGPTCARLRAALNLPDSVNLPVPTEIVTEAPPLNRDSVRAEALTNNPDLRAIEHLILKEKAAVSLAKKASYPNFAFGVDYVETGQAMNPLTPESGKDPWLVNVSINLPIWFGKNKAIRKEARARYRMAQDNLSEATNSLTAFAEEVIFEYENARRKVKLYRDGLIPKAEQSLNVSYAAYQTGEVDFLSVLDAQRQLLDFELQLEQSRANGAKKLAELEMITGHEINVNP